MKIEKIIITLFFNIVFSQSWVKDQLNDRQINQAINSYNSGRFTATQSILNKILQERENLNREPAMALLIKLQIALNQTELVKESSKKFFSEFPMSLYQKNVMESLGDFYVNQANYTSAYRMYIRSKKLNQKKNNYNDRINKKLLKLIQVRIPVPTLSELIILELDEESKNIHNLAKANTELLNGQPSEAAKTLSDINSKNLPKIFSPLFEDLLKAAFNPPLDILMVGLVLPLSGEQSDYGKAFLEGFAKASRNRKKDKNQISVIIQDTKSNDLQSVKIVKNLNKIKQLSALICPLFDHTSLAVVSSLSDSNIPVLLPNARKENLVQVYRNTFLTSSTIALEAKIAANFAVKKLKLDSLAVLAPADEYGEIQTDSFIKEVDRLGASIVATQWYTGEPKNLRRQFKRFREIAFNLNKKEDDFENVLGMNIDSLDALFDISSEDFFDLPEPEKKVMTSSDSSKIILSSIQGIYIPLKSSDVEYIGPQIPMYNFNTKIIGNSNWQDIETLKKENIGPHLKGMHFTTSYRFDLADSLFLNEDYIDDFYRGYNTSALLSNLNVKDKSRPEINIALSDLSHHEGLGYFYSSSLNNRNINSALQILEFDGKKFNYVGVFKNDSLDTSNNLNF